jgi:hypothetical protein
MKMAQSQIVTWKQENPFHLFMETFLQRWCQSPWRTWTPTISIRKWVLSQIDLFPLISNCVWAGPRGHGEQYCAFSCLLKYHKDAGWTWSSKGAIILQVFWKHSFEPAFLTQAENWKGFLQRATEEGQKPTHFQI